MQNNEGFLHIRIGLY